jgi:hypothetical protein
MFVMSLSEIVTEDQSWQTLSFHDIEARSISDYFYELLLLKKPLQFVYVITLQCNKSNSSSINVFKQQ